jgi:hypothetical protein
LSGTSHNRWDNGCDVRRIGKEVPALHHVRPRRVPGVEGCAVRVLVQVPWRVPLVWRSGAVEAGERAAETANSSVSRPLNGNSDKRRGPLARITRIMRRCARGPE